jgi:hypothetical protein
VQHFNNWLVVGVNVNQALWLDLVQKAGVFVFEFFFVSVLFLRTLMAFKFGLSGLGS